MRIYFLSILLIFSIVFRIFSKETPDLIVHSYTPITRSIDTVLELDFYEDGLIKEIRKYLNPQMRGIPSAELNKLDDIELKSITSIVRSDTSIEVYKQENSNEKVLIQKFSFLNFQEIRIWEKDYGDMIQKLILKDKNHFLYEYDNSTLFSYFFDSDTFEQKHFPTGNFSYYDFTDNILSSIREESSRSWKAHVVNNGNSLTITHEEEDVHPYLSKVDIIPNKYKQGTIYNILNTLIDASGINIYIDPILIGSLSPDINNMYPVFTLAEYDSSSYLTEGKILYLPKNLGVVLFSVPWVEGALGNGIGETITVSREIEFSELMISNGYYSFDKPELYEKNGRVKNVLIEGEQADFSIEIDLDDSPDPQKILLPSADNKVKITILDVYPGSKWEDTCLNYILVR